MLKTSADFVQKNLFLTRLFVNPYATLTEGIRKNQTLT